MKSRTSFFNGTVLGKDISRYAPVWGLYTIGLILFLLIANMDATAGDWADVLGSAIPGMSVVNLIYGGICALMVFGDLFKSRLCYATHALPLRREGWFLTHFTAGFLFSFVPNLLITLCVLPLTQPYWYMAILWLAANTLQFLFFFSAGAFSAVCAGNRLGAAAIYMILNFVVLLADWYAENIYTPLLYGIVFQGDLLELLMPVSYLSGLDFVEYTRRPFQFAGLVSADWLYLGILATVGVVLAILAVLIYRKRHMESAGDFLSLPAAKPVFLVVYTLTVGVVISQLISLKLLGLFIGLFVGFFTGKMLLARTVKVFRGWSFLQFGILVTLVGLSIGLTALDPAGMTRRVPEAKDVEVLYFYDSSDSHLYLNGSGEGRAISDPAEIEKFRQFHTEVADGRYKDTNASVPSDVPTVKVYLQYAIKNGTTVLRSYDIPVTGTHGDFVRTELSSWQSVFYTNDWESFAGSVEQIELEINLFTEVAQHTMTDQEQVRGLLEAVKADCEAGNMAQNWSFHREDDTSSWMYIYDNAASAEDYNMHRVYSLNLNIFTSCENTIAYLESLDLDLVPYEK